MNQSVVSASARRPERLRRLRGGIWLFTAITLIAMWSLVSGAATSLREAALDKARGDASNLSAGFSEQVRQVMLYVVGTMNLLDQRLKVEDRNFDLHKWAPAIPEIAAATIQVAFLGADGRIVASTVDRNAKGMDMSDREHFRVHVDNPNLGVFVGKPVLGRVSRKVTIQITKRLTWADGSFAGVLLFSVDPRLLTSLHEKTDLGYGGVISLVGEDRVIRARFTKTSGDVIDPRVGSTLPANRIFEEAASADSGAFEVASVIDQIDRVYSWRRVSGFPLIVIVGLGRAEALAAANRFVIIAVSAAALLTILLIAISIQLDRETARRAKNEAELAAEREKLAASQDHLTRAQRIARIGSMEIDLATGAIAWSAEVCRIFGVEAEEVQPTTDFLYIFIHPDDRGAVLDAAAQARRFGVGTPPLEYRIVRPDGTTRRVYRENATLTNEEGKPTRRLLIYKDVTELRLAQEREARLHRQLMHSQRLEALGTLAGGIAHDLNNTLVPIMAITKLLLAETPANDPVREDIATIMRASERARDLVKQILAFSRKQDLIRQEVDLAALVREALQMLRAGLPATIRIVEQIDDVPAFFADAGELHQVFVNLVTNAAQAIGSEIGVITIGLARVEDGVALAIRDTGCGMDTATAERVFEPFFTTKGVGEGTGLGLSVVHGIVSNHGGRIQVASCAGEGTTFTVFFPTAETTATELEPIAA